MAVGKGAHTRDMRWRFVSARHKEHPMSQRTFAHHLVWNAAKLVGKEPQAFLAIRRQNGGEDAVYHRILADQHFEYKIDAETAALGELAKVVSIDKDDNPVF